MRRKSLNLTPVERAVAYAKFSKMLTSAHLQALVGGDMNRVLDSVCTLLFIAAAAAHHADILDADVKIIHGSCRASVQACSEERLTDLHRGALESGLLALERLRPRLPVPALVLASTEVSILIRQGGVYWRDFQKYVPECV